MITARKLTKTYVMGKVHVPALRGVDIDVKRGEFVAIMGASGSGKSTLLHLLGLLDEPTSGKIQIEGKNVLSFTPKGRTDFRLHEFGYVFQEYALVRELTALENVYLPAMMKSLGNSDQKENAKKLLKQVGLGDRLNHLPFELSGGEQQRVAVARALINNPKIIFADEPTANLDSKMSFEIIHLLRDLNRKFKQTIVMVTHERSLGSKADRTIWLRDGKVTKKAYY
ncbi:ABC transporter ATP-binding protein [Candidatus Woesearchaeota archaeon]|nr:ABC transporter ATP-binding protein [Candidatus Woesearchaeota archaeon]